MDSIVMTKGDLAQRVGTMERKVNLEARGWKADAEPAVEETFVEPVRFDSYLDDDGSAL